MRNFLFDSNPKCSGGEVCLIDERGKEVHYKLQRVKGNGCILTVTEGDIERDSIVFTITDLKALFCLITVKENG